MNFRLGRSLSSAIALLASVASAITVPNVCKESLNDGIRDNYSTYDTRQAATEYQKRVCKLDATSYSTYSTNARSLDFDVAVADVVIGLGAAEKNDSGTFRKTFNSFCSDTRFADNSSATIIANRSTINESLASSYNACAETYLNAFMQLNKFGTFISITPQTIMSGTPPLQLFTVDVEVNTAQIQRVKIDNILPNVATIKCYYNNKPVGRGTQFQVKEFQLTCTKPADSNITFSIDTYAGKSNKVLIPNLKSRYDEMSGQIAALQTQINRMADQQASTNKLLITNIDGLASWKANSESYTTYATTPGKSGQSGVITCGDGYYAVGVQVLDADDGGFCVNCLTAVRLVCRPLNITKP